MFRLSSSRLVLVSLAFFFLASPWRLNAQEQESHPTKEALAKFGTLPVRFNGRVTTYDVIAKNYLRQFSGREVCYDKEGKEHPAVRWLLDVIAERDDSDHWRIFKVTSAELLKRVKLEPHKAGKPAENLYSMADLRKQAEALLAMDAKLQGKAEDQKDDADRAFGRLRRHLAMSMDFQSSCAGPKTAPGDNAQAILGRLEMLERLPLPCFLPKADGSDWMIYPRALVTDVLAKDGEKSQPFQHFEEMRNSHRANDAEAFSKALESYRQSLAGIEAEKSPFDFSPSSLWLETGVPPARELYFFSDANAPGLPIVDLYLADAPESRFIVSYFQGQSFSEVDLVNSWRIQLGLAPLSERDLKQTWKPTLVAGRRAVLIDDETPAYVDLPKPTRYITTIMKEGDQTFVFAYYGEKAIVAKHFDAYEDLMRSIQLGSAKELAAWFGGQGENPPILSERFLAAVVPDGKQVWVFATSGTDQAMQSHRETILEFLKTLKLKKTKDQRTELDGQLPEGWSKVGDYGEVTFVLGQGENSMLMTVTPLGDARDETVPMLADYWAKKLRLDPLTEQDRKSAIKEIAVAGRKAFLIELQRPEEAEAAGDSEITFQAPKGWKELPPGPLMKGSFEITHVNREVKLTIAALPANQNLVANINRWRTQLELPMQTEDEILKGVKDLSVDNLPGKLVELHNADTRQRILAAIVTSGGKDWFFKMMGDASAVEKEQKAFEEFLKTVKFPQKEQTKTEEKMP